MARLSRHKGVTSRNGPSGQWRRISSGGSCDSSVAGRAAALFEDSPTGRSDMTTDTPAAAQETGPDLPNIYMEDNGHEKAWNLVLAYLRPGENGSDPDHEWRRRRNKTTNPFYWSVRCPLSEFIATATGMQCTNKFREAAGERGLLRRPRGASKRNLWLVFDLEWDWQDSGEDPAGSPDASIPADDDTADRQRADQASTLLDQLLAAEDGLAQIRIILAAVDHPDDDECSGTPMRVFLDLFEAIRRADDECVARGLAAEARAEEALAVVDHENARAARLQAIVDIVDRLTETQAEHQLLQKEQQVD